MSRDSKRGPSSTHVPSSSNRSTFGKAWDRLQGKLGLSTGKPGSELPPKKRRVSRKQKEEQRTRWLYIGLAAIGGAIIILLAGTAINEFVLTPRKVLASVESDDITRRDYWKYETYNLLNQSVQYQQYSSLVEPAQQQQYLNLAQQSSAAADDVWGSTSTNDLTLSRMIDDEVYLDGLGSLGLSVDDQDVDLYIDRLFAAPAAPLVTPTPSPTLIPARAEWATQTAAALLPPDASPVAVGGTPLASPVPDGVSTPAAVDASPDAVSGSPFAIPTVSQADAEETAEANFEDFSNNILDEAHMSVDDYKSLVVEPEVAREKVNAYFAEEVGQSAEQVHALHILVGTSELADNIYNEVVANPDSFEALAQQSSIDEGTAPNGGDLGWFPRGIMVEPFEEVAFSLEPGQISEPIQTEFGWHIIMVVENDEDRALTDQQIQQASQALADRWLEQQKAEMDISSSIEPTPTPAVAQFVPPAEAPPAPTQSLNATPLASPEAAAPPESNSSPESDG